MSFSSPILIFAAVAAVYALPGIVAVLRRRRSHWLILAVNILFGWTLVGWVGAACWALAPQRARSSKIARPQKVSASAHPARDDRFANDNASTQVVHRSTYVWDDARAPDMADDYAAWLDSGAALVEPTAPSKDAIDRHQHAA